MYGLHGLWEKYFLKLNFLCGHFWIFGVVTAILPDSPVTRRPNLTVLLVVNGLKRSLGLFFLK